jgi:hypothetical protein
VCGDAGLPVDDEAGLIAAIRTALAMSENERNDYRRRARKRVLERYCWDSVTTQYEQLFARIKPA